MRRLNKSYPYQKQLKNRSSKDNNWLCGPGTMNILRCVSGAQLQKWVRTEVRGALAEQNRRLKRKDAKEMK